MKKIALGIIAASFASGAALAQSTTIEPASAQTVITPDFTFDLDRTVDPSLPPLPADAGDYEVANPGEVQTITSVTFDLD